MIEEENLEKELEKDKESEYRQIRFSIDLEWYRDQERSFIALASSRLCPTCQEKKTPKSETALLNAIKQCCAKNERFFAPNLPLLEMVFRAFLANGNQPLSLEQLQSRLQQWLSYGSPPRDVPILKLKRMLGNDVYYGLRPVSPKGQE
jgi:hypothetical protein